MSFRIVIVISEFQTHPNSKSWAFNSAKMMLITSRATVSKISGDTANGTHWMWKAHAWGSWLAISNKHLFSPFRSEITEGRIIKVGQVNRFGCSYLQSVSNELHVVWLLTGSGYKNLIINNCPLLYVRPSIQNPGRVPWFEPLIWTTVNQPDPLEAINQWPNPNLSLVNIQLIMVDIWLLYMVNDG